MRWPFGPPHLTLKPSKKNNQKNNKKNTKKNKTTTSNHKAKNKTSKTKTKARQKRKTNTRNTKTFKPSKPRWTTMSHPSKNPKNRENTSIFTNFETIPDTPKTNFLTLKPQRNKPKKHHFAMFKNNPLFFIIFCFFEHIVFVFEKLCFAENTIK